MQRVLSALLMVIGMATMVLAQTQAPAQGPDRWLHVRVQSSDPEGETVRVNVPLSLAEKILPAIHCKELKGGKVSIKDASKDVDLRALLEAVRNVGDNEFVTVESAHERVRVAKSGGYLLVKVREGQAANATENVDIKIPLSVVEAALSGGQDELDLVAAIRALSAHGDAELVTVMDKSETVRVWVDSKNVSE